MDGPALLTPEVFARILANDAFLTALAAEIEAINPGIVDRAHARAVGRVRETFAGEKIGDEMEHALNVLQRRARAPS